MVFMLGSTIHMRLNVLLYHGLCTSLTMRCECKTAKEENV